MTLPRRTVHFPDGRSADVVEVPPHSTGDDLLTALRLPPPRATVVVNGTAAALEPALAERLADVLGAAGLAGAARSEGLTVVTGGTDAGIVSILGRAMADRSAPLVGVAPLHLVRWPGEAAPDRIPLEDHHSHFVLVDGNAWGDETPALLTLAAALTRYAPSAAVICGGGPVTGLEALGHARDGRPLVVLAGSGRIADQLAAAVAGDQAVAGSEIAEIAAGGVITVCPLSAGPAALADAVRTALFPR